MKANPYPIRLQPAGPEAAFGNRTLTRAGCGIWDQVGNTPLVPIRNILKSDRIRILAKLEWFNPGGSVKDRPALAMIRAAERSGALRAGKTILDATSGNTGIALAMLGTALGYPVHLALPANASKERLKILRIYGAEVDLTDPLKGADGAVEHAQKLTAEYPDRFHYADQYSNPANWQSHYETTGPEILTQLEGEIDCFVAGIGTSGTLVGISRRLKEQNSQVLVAGFTPDSPLHGIEGLKHLPSAHTPAIFDPRASDLQLEVSTDSAQELARRLALEEGLFAGTSSGAALAAALEVARQLEKGTIVTVFPDGGTKYLSQGPWGIL